MPQDACNEESLRHVIPEDRGSQPLHGVPDFRAHALPYKDSEKRLTKQIDEECEPLLDL